MDEKKKNGNFSFLTIEDLKNPGRLPYTKRDFVQKGYPEFWGGANEVVRIFRELQNLMVEFLPKYKQVVPRTFEKLKDDKLYDVFLKYIQYRILYYFAEAVWKKTDQYCGDLLDENKSESAKLLLLHSMEVFDAYPIIDIVSDDEDGFKKMKEMIDNYDSQLDFGVIPSSSSHAYWTYKDILGTFHNGRLQSEQLWKDVLEAKEPTEANIGELLDDDRMIVIY